MPQAAKLCAERIMADIADNADDLSVHRLPSRVCRYVPDGSRPCKKCVTKA